MFLVRYYISRFLLDLALKTMPNCPYKKELTRRIYDLKYEAIIQYVFKNKGDSV